MLVDSAVSRLCERWHTAWRHVCISHHVAAGQRGGSGYVHRHLLWRGDSVDSGIGLFLQRNILNGGMRSIPRVRYGQFSRL